MNIKDTGRHGVALGLASILVAGGSLALPSAAEASQLRTDGGVITIYGVYRNRWAAWTSISTNMPNRTRNVIG